MRKLFYILSIVLVAGAIYNTFHSDTNTGNSPSKTAKIANAAEQPSSANDSPEPSPTEDPQIQTDTSDDQPKTLEIIDYTVASGDTLSTIAQDHNIHVATITAENNITATTVLKIGQVLHLLPIDALHYQVQSGDTLLGIAKKYGVDVAKIVSVNSLDENAPLSVGQWLFLPGAEEGATTAPTTTSSSQSSSSSTSTTSQTSGGITWTAGALAELNKIYLPAAIPVVRAKVEAYAREHGITVIDRATYLSIHV